MCDAGFAEVHLIFALHITAKANKPSRVFVTQTEPERLLAPRHLQRLLVFSVLLLSDIRDTVNYKEVMKQYGLGPNGGIVTSLNLFATRFDQVTHKSQHLAVRMFTPDKQFGC